MTIPQETEGHADGCSFIRLYLLIKYTEENKKESTAGSEQCV
jgi:hypothetical protein